MSKKIAIEKFIDQTLLKPEATSQDVRKLCEEALKFKFAAVCVNPFYVPLVNELLSGSPVKTCTVAGFPLGANFPETKAAEARKALQAGAAEIDMVINIGELKAGNLSLVRQDIEGVVKECRNFKALCKVIIETALLNEEEKINACMTAADAGADFVKTSTGFAGAGATVDDVKLMKRTVLKNGLRVKASGGIRSFADTKLMIEAGADRIGTSSGVKIVQQAYT